MANYNKRNDFPLLVELLERTATTLAAGKVPDAKALIVREKGAHNLQGHARRVMPLAVWLVLKRPELLKLVRAKTKLSNEMKASSSEARSAVWGAVKAAMIDEIAKAGTDIVSQHDRANTPVTAKDIAQTYLSADYRGGQTKGGAGNTVLKRAVKLLAHVLPS